VIFHNPHLLVKLWIYSNDFILFNIKNINYDENFSRKCKFYWSLLCFSILLCLLNITNRIIFWLAKKEYFLTKEKGKFSSFIMERNVSFRLKRWKDCLEMMIHFIWLLYRRKRSEINETRIKFNRLENFKRKNSKMSLVVPISNKHSPKILQWKTQEEKSFCDFPSFQNVFPCVTIYWIRYIICKRKEKW
jgi:hypothetical protein